MRITPAISTIPRVVYTNQNNNNRSNNISLANRTNSQNFNGKYLLEGSASDILRFDKLFYENLSKKFFRFATTFLCPFIDKGQKYLSQLITTDKDTSYLDNYPINRGGFEKSIDELKDCTNKRLDIIFGDEANSIPRIPVADAINDINNNNFDFQNGIKSTSKATNMTSEEIAEMKNKLTLALDRINTEYDKGIVRDMMEKHTDIVQELYCAKNPDGSQFFSLYDINDILYNCKSTIENNPTKISEILADEGEMKYISSWKCRGAGLWRVTVD